MLPEPVWAIIRDKAMMIAENAGKIFNEDSLLFRTSLDVEPLPRAGHWRDVWD